MPVPNSGKQTAEVELNGCVREYLECKQLNDTLQRFVAECQLNGIKLPDVRGKGGNSSKLLATQNEMVRLFHQGAFMEFFQLWDEHLSDEIRQSVESQKLEFKVNIYFAVYPLLRRNISGNQSPNSLLEQGMANFKYYLETKGSNLSQTTEFLPYYALPFVPNPRTHPSFQTLFEDTWSSDLQRTLEDFLSSALQSSINPRLFEIYLAGTKEQDYKLIQKQTQQQIYDSEKRAMNYNRKYQKIQADYHNLISIAADLIDSLEQAVQGHPVDMDFLQTMCQRLFANQLRQSVSTSTDLRRPGTAGNMLRQSIAVNKMNEAASDFLQIGNIDFEKIKYILTDGDGDQKALLLQAIRWRLTRTTPSERDHMLAAYIRHDLLGCTSPGLQRRGIMALFTANDEVVRQYSARLFNAFASLSKGRTYLAQNEELLRVLIETLKAEERDSVTRENVLGALQKLSLRRQLQTAMIEEGIIEWLVQLLEYNDDLSDYTLEYSIALTMNLCLRTAGKKRCARDPHLVLKVLSDLLGHDNTEIRPYVNGALYSILGIPSIREEARAMSMEDILRCFIKSGQPDMNRQIEFIIKQLASDSGEEDLSDDEEDDDDEEDQEAMEADLDKAEVLKPDPSRPQGDRLLLLQYTISEERRNKPMKRLQEAPFNRPVTPNQVRPGSIIPSHTLAAVSEYPEMRHDRPPSGSSSYRNRAVNGDHRPPSGQSNGSRNSRSLSHSSTGSSSGNSMNKPGTPTERPMTRSGSRPTSGDSGNGSGVIPRPRSGGKKGTAAAVVANPDYVQAFAAKPKIPRTPDTRSLTSTLPPQPTFSDTLPSPRPNSGSSNRGAAGSENHSRSRGK